VKVLVIDDHALIRAGLRPVLEQLVPGETVTVLEAPSYTQGVEIASAHPDLDLLLLDLNLPNVTGLAALVDLQERFPEIPVVIVSGEDDPAMVRETFERGALGFIPKSSSSAVILSALRLVLSGGTYLPPEIMMSTAPAPQATPGRTASNAQGLDLTPRQAEVMGLVLAGKPNKIIGRELGLAEGTVKNHVAAVLRALGASNRVEAVIAAAKLGIKA
jgi:DNA-binding NarL/FixJ family response regulator